MKKYAWIITLLLFTLALAPLLSFQTIAKAGDEILTTEKCEPEEIKFQVHFSKVEKTGMIESFDVSIEGRAATHISHTGLSIDINVYDQYGFYDYTIYMDITHSEIILNWDEETLLIHLQGYIIKVNGYDEYEIYKYPADDNAKKFWHELELEKITDELITDKGRYYVQYGNLRYIDNESAEDYAVTENTSFRPWWLLSIPILTAIIWFGFVRKRIKEWEEEQNKKF